MDKQLKLTLLSSSSGWLAALLNFIPGLGTGYIYQRRWKAYWITTATSALWIIFGSFKDLEIDPADPLQTNDDSIILIGLIIIAAITAFEAWYASKIAKEKNAQS